MEIIILEGIERRKELNVWRKQGGTKGINAAAENSEEGPGAMTLIDGWPKGEGSQVS